MLGKFRVPKAVVERLVPSTLLHGRANQTAQTGQVPCQGHWEGIQSNAYKPSMKASPNEPMISPAKLASPPRSRLQNGVVKKRRFWSRFRQEIWSFEKGRLPRARGNLESKMVSRPSLVLHCPRTQRSEFVLETSSRTRAASTRLLPPKRAEHLLFPFRAHTPSPHHSHLPCFGSYLGNGWLIRKASVHPERGEKRLKPRNIPWESCGL